MKKKIILLCIVLVALILELLPYGAVCNFANPEGEPWRYAYSYFDLTPFGNANFAPFIVALLTCALLLLIVISMIVKKPMKITLLSVSAAAALISLCPLLLGIRFLSPVGVLISIVFTGTTVVAALMK